jgi:hypothetical protein
MATRAKTKPSVGTGAASITRRLLVLAAALLLSGLTVGKTQAADEGQYKVVDGIAVYYGLMPASVVKGHPATYL